jgi:hypothetical protein
MAPKTIPRYCPLKQVLRIRDILVRTVRIRIRGSVPLTNDPDPAIFICDLQDGN